MHSPSEVNVEDVDEFISTVGVVFSADGIEEDGDGNVGADDGVQDPFQAQIGNAFETGRKRVDAGNCDGLGGSETLSGEKPEQGGFACSIGTNQ